jgi:hypothetical protein
VGERLEFGAKQHLLLLQEQHGTSFARPWSVATSTSTRPRSVQDVALLRRWRWVRDGALSLFCQDRIGNSLATCTIVAGPLRALKMLLVKGGPHLGPYEATAQIGVGGAASPARQRLTVTFLG